MTIPSQVQALGIPWYKESDYERLRTLFIDGHKLPTSFLQWQDSAEQIRKRHSRQGLLVVKAHIDPDTFPAWCVANNQKLDASGRTHFANTEAYRAVMAAKGN